jgi:putative flavoprotein involved in K+ transport
MHFPLANHLFPTRDQMAAYLEAYAGEMGLPVQTGIRVDGLWRGDDGGYVVTAGDRRFEARQVVLAAGKSLPKIPDFASALDPEINQLPSSEYQNPSQFRPGGVLVVGASNSGAEIALEAAREHPTVLAGRDPGHVPWRIDGLPFRVIVRGLWFVANQVLTNKTPPGRKARPHVRAHGGPLVRYKPSDLDAAGVERIFSRAVGSQDGLPLLENGRALDVTNVVWCTGFKLDTHWIHFPITGDDGWPLEEGGVSTIAPGLYFVGIPFQQAFSSQLIGGAGRDAGHVADQIAQRRKTA